MKWISALVSSLRISVSISFSDDLPGSDLILFRFPVRASQRSMRSKLWNANALQRLNFIYRHRIQFHRKWINVVIYVLVKEKCQFNWVRKFLKSWVCSGAEVCKSHGSSECCQMSIHLQKPASLQARTSPDNFAVCFGLATPWVL